MSLVLYGINHDTASVAVREKFAVQDAEAMLARLMELEGVLEAFLVATCNRTEIVLFLDDSRDPQRLLGKLIQEIFSQNATTFKEHFYTLEDEDVVFHLCDVVAGIDSMILGENQIVGQFKEAQETARAAGALGGVLTRLTNTALAAGKRVRNETGIGAGSVSVAGMAVRLAEQVLDSLAGKHVLIVGAGKMSELVAVHLRERGINQVYVTNKTHEKAVALARQLLGDAIPFDDLSGGLEKVDIVITSTACPKAIITAPMVREVMRQRRWRPLFLVDIALPRDVEPKVGDLENVYLYDIDDLKKVVEGSLENRRKDLDAAREIIKEEGRGYLRWYFSLDAVPVIKNLLEHYEGIRKKEIARYAHRVSQMGPEAEELMEEISKALTAKFLHKPIAQLREVDSREDSRRRLRVINAFLGE